MINLYDAVNSVINDLDYSAFYQEGKLHSTVGVPKMSKEYLLQANDELIKIVDDMTALLPDNATNYFISSFVEEAYIFYSSGYDGVGINSHKMFLN